MADHTGQLGYYCFSWLMGVGGFAEVYLGEHIHVDFESLFSHQLQSSMSLLKTHTTKKVHSCFSASYSCYRQHWCQEEEHMLHWPDLGTYRRHTLNQPSLTHHASLSHI